jgi:hypothetical protein
MNDSSERRERHRRFEDRRMALLLALHEVLLEEPPGRAREESLLATLKEDFCVNRAALLRLEGAVVDAPPRLAAIVGDVAESPLPDAFDGVGATSLFDLHRKHSGALTLTKFRRPSAFSDGAWTHLWEVELGASFTALLSVELVTRRAPRAIVWLLLEHASREWNSHDRELAEEAASLLGRAADKALE